MSMISQEQLSNIRNSINIVDIVSRYIPLTQKGSNYWGVCPFHQDTNPSMSVSNDKQIFTCFSCHKTGNVFNFVMDYEHISFIEAVNKVAQAANIKLEINVPNHTSNLNNNLYKIYEDTQKIYQNNIKTEYGKDAREYLLKRGINEDIIKDFGIGLSLKSRDVLVKSFFNKKYTAKDLIDSGLIIKNEYGMVDIYTNRIMFPLYDLNGRVVGYSGRIYDTKDGSKYINTKQTSIFTKGELLYNYHRSKEICRKQDIVIVMEGFMDVIAAHQVGVYNTIAMMGTAVTKHQANLIRRMASNIILCFDGDDAGEKATMNCIDELLQFGITPKVVRLEDKLDPDEYIKKYGKDRFVDKISNPINIMDFKLNYLKKGRNLTSDVEKASYVNDILKNMEDVKDDILVELTLKKLSIESGLDIEFLRSKLKKEEEPKIVVEVKKEIKTTKYQKAESRLLFYMLRSNDAIKIYNKEVTYLPTDRYRYLARQIAEYYKTACGIKIADFIDSVGQDKELLDTIGEIESLNLKEECSTDELYDYVKAIHEFNIKSEIKRLESQMKNEDNVLKKAEICEQIRKLKVRGNE